MVKNFIPQNLNKKKKKKHGRRVLGNHPFCDITHFLFHMLLSPILFLESLAWLIAVWIYLFAPPPLHPAPKLGAGGSFPVCTSFLSTSQYLAHSQTEVKPCWPTMLSVWHGQKHRTRRRRRRRRRSNKSRWRGRGACPGTARRAKNQPAAAANKSRWTYVLLHE